MTATKTKPKPRRRPVPRPSTNGHAAAPETPDLARLCNHIIELHRNREAAVRSRVMMENRLRAVIMEKLGYNSRLSKEERGSFVTRANAVIKLVAKTPLGKPLPASVPDPGFVRGMLSGVDALKVREDGLGKDMDRLARQLPVAAWYRTVRGLGKTSLLSLAQIVGECGDLSNYSGPMKLWRRMGCAPFTFNGETLMPSTWKRRKAEGKGLPAKLWSTLEDEDGQEHVGYCDQRRKVAWNVGDCLMKQNGDGPYRKRYDDARARIAETHPEYSDGRHDKHARLLCVKLFLKDLWRAWRRAAKVECY